MINEKISVFVLRKVENKFKDVVIILIDLK